MLLAVIVGVAGAAGVISAANSRSSDVQRIEGLEEVLQAQDGPAVNYLLIGSDTRATADPIISVRKALARIEQGELDVSVPVYDGTDIGLLQAGFNRMASGLRERERLRDLFGRHVGVDVARRALEHGIELGGELVS